MEVGHFCFLGRQLALPRGVQTANEEFGGAGWLQAVVSHCLPLVKSFHHVVPFSSEGALLLLPSTLEHILFVVGEDNFGGANAVLLIDPIKTELKIENLPTAADQEKGPPGVLTRWGEQ